MSAAIKPVTILIAAAGNEDANALAGWIVDAAWREGFPAQKTAMPGMLPCADGAACYIEIFPEKNAPAPVMALAPSPADIDLLVAAELLEAGRAMQDVFVTPERTTLVASTHRVYATAEKMTPVDGRYDARRILQAAPKAARKAVLFDLPRLAQETNATHAAVLFGAVAGSGALPLSREMCERVLKEEEAAEAHLRGFAAGHAAAVGEQGEKEVAAKTFFSAAKEKNTDCGNTQARIQNEFPAPLHALLDEAVMRLADYQDAAYAGLYLDRVRGVLAVDREAGGESGGWPLTKEAARLLALWMSYEDIIRIARLKSHASRFARLRREAGAKAGQIVFVTDYLKPSVNDLTDILPPAWAGRFGKLGKLGKRDGAGRALRLRSHTVAGFLALRCIAALKPLRRKSARFGAEQALIERWLGDVKRLGFAAMDAGLALEIVQCASLMRGYGEAGRERRAAFVRILDDIVENQQAVAKGADSLKSAIRKARETALGYPPSESAPAVKGKPIVWMKRGAN